MAPEAGTTSNRDLIADPVGYQVDDLTIDPSLRDSRPWGRELELVLQLEVDFTTLERSPNDDTARPRGHGDKRVALGQP